MQTARRACAGVETGVNHMIRIGILMALLAAATSGLAQSSPTAAFNEAWRAYAAAKEAGDKEGMLEPAGRALELAREIMPPDDERIPMLMSNYGVALSDNGRIFDAREILEESVELTERIHGKYSEQMIPVLMNYADARGDYGDTSGTIRSYRQAVDVAEKLYGRDSLEAAGISLRAGFKLIALSDGDGARRFIRDAHEFYLAEFGPTHRNTAFAEFNLGKIEFGQRDYADAIEHFLNALAGFGGGQPEDTQLEMTTRAFLVRAYESRGMSEEATEHCLAIGANSMITPDQEYMPLFRKAPRYPLDMLENDREGFVDVEFTVDESGFVRNPRVIELEGGKSFERAALDAVEGFRYAPRFEDGNPIAVDDVKTRITFRIEE